MGKFNLLKISLFLIIILNKNFSIAEKNVCVIGGGIAGLAISKLLQDKGYDISLFEKDNRWGGKIATYKTPGNEIVLEKGAVVFGPLQKYMNKYMSHYNVSTIPYPLFRDIALMDPKSAAIYRYIVTQKQREQILEAFQKFEHKMQKYPSYRNFGYTDIPPDSDMMALSYGDFLRKNHLEELHVSTAIAGMTTGYGSVDDIPAIYYLRMIRPEETVIEYRDSLPWFTARDGYDVLMNRMAQDVHKKFLNHEAIKILRENGQQIVTILVNKSEKKTVKCWRTILAFPPLLKFIRIIKDLDAQEEAVFAQVKVNKYISSGHLIPSFRYLNYFGFSPKAMVPEGKEIFPVLNYPEGNGEVLMFSRGMGSRKVPFAYVGYEWIAGDYDSEASTKDVKMVAKNLEKFVKKVHPLSQNLFLENWVYFPHVTSESIKNGFYKKFDKIQGKGGIFYATTLLTFEMMDPTLEMADALVQKYF